MPHRGNPPSHQHLGLQRIKDLAVQRVSRERAILHQAAKGLGQHLILPNGRVYVRGFKFFDHDANGRLLRIEGVLRKRHVRKAPPGAQGYNADFDYFYVDTSWQKVDKLTDPQNLPRGKR